MKLEQTGYLVPVVSGCMKTVESWMAMDKSVFVHIALCFTHYLKISFLESAIKYNFSSLPCVVHCLQSNSTS